MMQQLRNAVASRLRRRGFQCVRRARRSSGSAYYARGQQVIRISDHELPETDERRHNRTVGRVCCTDEILLACRVRTGTSFEFEYRPRPLPEILADLELILDEFDDEGTRASARARYGGTAQGGQP